MTRGMSLTVLLMGASMAAAIAAPGVDAVATPWRCADVDSQSAQEAPSTVLAAAPAVAAFPVSSSTLAPSCASDPAQIYRQWHHGASKLGVDCLVVQNGFGAVAQSR